MISSLIKKSSKYLLLKIRDSIVFITITLSILGGGSYLYAAWTSISASQTQNGAGITQTLMDAIRTNLDDLNTRVGVVPSADTANDGSVLLNSAGLANQTAYYTPYVSLGRGTYSGMFYNCIASASADYYLFANVEGASGSHGYVWSFNNNKPFSTPSFIFKVNAATSNVRLRVGHANGGTISDSVPTCSTFVYHRIGP